MENNIILIILGIPFVLCAIIFGIIAYIYTKREYEKNIYVYTKTNIKYKVLYRCKLKIPVSGSWMDAIIYQSIDDGNLYVREKRDFFSKFIRLKYWKHGNENRRDE